MKNRFVRFAACLMVLFVISACVASPISAGAVSSGLSADDITSLVEAYNGLIKNENGEREDVMEVWFYHESTSAASFVLGLGDRFPLYENYKVTHSSCPMQIGVELSNDAVETLLVFSELYNKYTIGGVTQMVSQAETYNLNYSYSQYREYCIGACKKLWGTDSPSAISRIVDNDIIALNTALEVLTSCIGYDDEGWRNLLASKEDLPRTKLGEEPQYFVRTDKEFEAYLQRMFETDSSGNSLFNKQVGLFIQYIYGVQSLFTGIKKITNEQSYPVTPASSKTQASNQTTQSAQNQNKSVKNADSVSSGLFSASLISDEAMKGVYYQEGKTDNFVPLIQSVSDDLKKLQASGDVSPYAFATNNGAFHLQPKTETTGSGNNVSSIATWYLGDSVYKRSIGSRSVYDVYFLSSDVCEALDDLRELTVKYASSSCAAKKANTAISNYLGGGHSFSSMYSKVKESSKTLWGNEDIFYCETQKSKDIATLNKAVSTIKGGYKAGAKGLDKVRNLYPSDARKELAESELSNYLIGFMNTFDEQTQALYNLIEDEYSLLYSVNNSALLSDIAEPTEAKPAGRLESDLSELIISIATGLRSALYKGGMSLDGIIYGRVQVLGGVPVLTNYFNIDFNKGNIYGLIGSMVFSLLRDLFTTINLSAAMLFLAKGGFGLDGAKKSAMTKQSVEYSLIAMTLMYSMPSVIDAAIKVRDRVLKSMNTALVSAVSSRSNSTFSTTGKFLELAETDGHIISALMYLGMVCLTLYFAAIYISSAMAAMLMLAFFPLILVFGYTDNSVVRDWWRYMFGILIVPLIDAVLLFVPSIALIVDKDITTKMPIVLLILSASIIPSRGAIRMALHMGNSVGAEMTGVGALMMAGRLVQSTVNTAKNVGQVAVGGTVATISDARMSKMYSDLDKQDTADEAVSVKMRRTGFKLADKSGQFDGNYNSNYQTPMPLMKQDSNGHWVQERDSSGNPIVDNTKVVLSDKAKLDPNSMFRAAGAGGGSGSGGGHSSRSVERQRIFDKNATTGVLGTKMEDSLTNKRKAELYKRRAIYTGLKTVGTTLGGSAGAAGGTLIGVGAGSMLGTNAMMGLGAAGMSVGGELGMAGGAAFGSLVGELAVDVPGALKDKRDYAAPDIKQQIANYSPATCMRDVAALRDELQFGDPREAARALFKKDNTDRIEALAKNIAGAKTDSEIRSAKVASKDLTEMLAQLSGAAANNCPNYLSEKIPICDYVKKTLSKYSWAHQPD